MYKRQLDEGLVGIWKLSFDEPMPLDIPNQEKINHILKHSFISEANTTFSKFYGLDKNQTMIGTYLEEFMPPDKPETYQLITKFIEKNYELDHELTFETDIQGKSKVFINNCHGEIADQKLSSILGTSIDFTEQYKIQHEYELKNLVHQVITDGFVISDANADDMPIIYVNDRFTEITGYSNEEVIGLNCRFLQGEKTDKNTVGSIKQALKQEKPIHGTILNYRKDGTEFWNKFNIVPIMDRQNKILYFIGNIYDVTNEIENSRKITELNDSLAKLSQRLQLNEMTTMVSHEISQPLTAILANTESLRLMTDNYPGESIEYNSVLNDIKEDTDRIVKIISGLRAILKQDDVKLETWNLNDIVLNTLSLIKSDLFFKKIDFRTELATDLPHAKILPIQIQQVILNLIKNASDSVIQCDVARHKIELTTKVYSPGKVILEVTDFGTGIKDKSSDKLFEPYYSDKSDGLGVGLSICKTIINNHNGQIWVKNNPVGATAAFILPVEAQG